ncbi:ATP-binding protein [Alcaligenes faecalis]|uniref:ATP-binding protein n=1 Tax=Alcaligenes faecalis TaxID=511 RepID=UPI002933EAE1|nr:ATP-binding protein [Alcaligenes faecalis]MDV2115614.1 ATP-binding protein [Alcaligenes faecalis]
MLDTLPDAIVMFDSGGRLLGCNRAMRNMLGLPELVNGKNDFLDFFQRLENGLQADLAYLLPGISQAIYRSNHPFYGMHRDGEGERRRALEFHSYAAPAPDTATLLMIRDVTAHMQKERDRADCFAVAAHEIRSPLAAISGYIELLQLEATPSAWASKIYMQLHEKVRGVDVLLDELTQLNRIEYDGVGSREWRASDLRAVLRLSLRAFNEQRQRICLDLPSHSLWARVDVVPLLVALRNALENALKYSAADTVVILRLRPGQAGWACIEVLDQGPGIDPIYQDKVFDKFYRLPGQQVQGSGLGLSILRSIVRHHGGRVYFKEHPGPGAHLVMELVLLPSASYTP